MEQTMRPTVGHHFSDILICKQKAWLHYHGNSREKMRPPVYLRVMQTEGQRLEADIYESNYKGAYKVPGFGAKSLVRSGSTKEAMKRGEPIILQGYVETPLGNGTMDVMEKVGPDPVSRVGHSYRVGEIKRSEKLLTAHIMQVKWYTELLEQAFEQKVTEGFFILGEHTNHIHVEDLTQYTSDYENIKEALFHLRDSTIAPGEHLIPACASCDWRGVCMPRLIQRDHMSLLPVITPSQVEYLKSLGYDKWQDVEFISDQVFLELGLSIFDIELVRKSRENLAKGLTSLRNEFRKDLFDGAVGVSLDFQNLSSNRQAEGGLHPTFIYWYEGTQLHSAEIQYEMDEIRHLDINDLLASKKLVFYGGTDIGAFSNILKQIPDKKSPELFDIFNFIDQNVHAPVPGLELRTLVQHILKQETTQTGPQRAWAISQVLNWISASL